MSTRKFMTADVFTTSPLSGNPVAVFTDAKGMTTTEMQKVAQEMNLSETTFILPPKKDGDFHVRIFTPVNELPFAGHPTLGTAIVMGQAYPKQQLKLETAMGTINFDLQCTEEGDVTAATMQQPIPTWELYEHQERLLEGLSLESSMLPVEIYRNGPRHVYVGLPSVEALSAVKPDLRILAEFPDVAVNCFSRDADHWRMRMFSPAYGVTEDAATGSAAGPLALHLARHGKSPFNRWIEIWQGVEMGRHSKMRAIVKGSAEKIDAIHVSGSAVIVQRGELRY